MYYVLPYMPRMTDFKRAALLKNYLSTDPAAISFTDIDTAKRKAHNRGMETGQIHFVLEVNTVYIAQREVDFS